MVKPTEKAVLIVNDDEFTDWETVYVKHSDRDDPKFLFRFTCSEGMPLAKNFAKLRIKPGMPCTIFLAGQLAMSARVEMRQVFFDAHRHHIELQGSSKESMASNVAAVTDKMEYLDKTVQQIGSSLLGHYGLNMVVKGGQLPNDKIKRFGLQVGENVSHAMERLFKNVPGLKGGVNFTSNPMGDFVISLGPEGGSDTIEEGKNMISGREIIVNPGLQAHTYASGQHPVMNNKTWGADAAFKNFSKMITGFVNGSPGAWHISEMSAWSNKFLEGQNANEVGFLGSDSITITAVVHGWLRPSGGLWEMNQPMSVISPMLIMTGSEELLLFRAEYTQDDQTGTRTTLTIVNKNARERMGVPLDVKDTKSPAATTGQG